MQELEIEARQSYLDHQKWVEGFQKAFKELKTQKAVKEKEQQEEEKTVYKEIINYEPTEKQRQDQLVELRLAMMRVNLDDMKKPSPGS